MQYRKCDKIELESEFIKNRYYANKFATCRFLAQKKKKNESKWFVIRLQQLKEMVVKYFVL